MDAVTLALAKKYTDNNVSAEQISSAVNNYLDEHPVTAGATEEEAAQIKQNETDITSVKETLGCIVNEPLNLYDSGDIHISGTSGVYLSETKYVNCTKPFKISFTVNNSHATVIVVLQLIGSNGDVKVSNTIKNTDLIDGKCIKDINDNCEYASIRLIFYRNNDTVVSVDDTTVFKDIKIYDLENANVTPNSEFFTDAIDDVVKSYGIEKKEEYTGKDLEDGIYLANTVNIGQVIKPYIVSDYKYLKLNAYSGMVINITSESIANGRAVCFFDNDMKNLKVFDASVKDLRIEVPDGVAYIVVNSLTSTSSKFLVYVYGTTDLIKELEDKRKYTGKSIIAIGDSHSSDYYRKHWLPLLCENLGFTNDEDVNSNVSIDADFTGYEQYVCSFLQGCAKLADICESVDCILLENVHFNFSGNIEDNRALVIDNVLTIGNIYSSLADLNDAWNNNAEQLLTSVESSKAIKTAIRMQYTKQKKTLTFSSSASVLSAGTIVLTIDGHDFTTSIDGGTTLEQAVAKLNAWRFEEYYNWSNACNGNTIDITYTKSDEPTAPTISFNGGGTGMTYSGVADSSIIYSLYKYFSNLDIANWKDKTKWFDITMWSPAYSIVKGAIEILQKAFPKAKIIMWNPGSYYISQDMLNNTFDLDSFYSTNSNYVNNRECQKHMKEISEYYKISCIDVDKLCGISPVNFTSYYNYNDVHLKPDGYARYAEVLADNI